MEPVQLLLPGFSPQPPMIASVRSISLGTLTPAMAIETAPMTFEVSHKAVSSRMQIWQEEGQPQKFKLTLFSNPWPLAGQVLGFAYGAFRFEGLIKRTDIRPADSSARRWECAVEGEVLIFEAPGVLGG